MSMNPASAEEDSINVTINLDDSDNDNETSNDVKRDFVPVKAGGKLLNDTTIELISDEEEEEEVAPLSPQRDLVDHSRYQTPFQTPNPNVSKSNEANETFFHSFCPTSSTPNVASANAKAKLAREFEESLSKHPMKVVEDVFEGKGVRKNDVFDELKDEFCQSLEEDDSNISAMDNNTAVNNVPPADNNEKDEDDDSAISSPSHDQSKRERSSTTEEYDTESKESADSNRGPMVKRRKLLLEGGSDLPSTVTVLRTANGKGIVYLVGTAHFSKESNADVAHVIQTVQPDCVMLELCPSRTEILRLDEKTLLEEGANMSMESMMAAIRRYGKVQGIMYLLMLSMSAQLTKELGMAPGGEFRTAVKEASKVPGCIVHLGDRPIQVTMKRAFASLSLYQKMKMAFNIITSKETITKEEVEKCKQKDLLESMLEEMAGEYPELTRVFVNERDIYLSYTLRNAVHFPNDISLDNPAVAVGVVGIGHVEGIKKYWEKVDQRDIRQVISIPQPSKTELAVKFVVKCTFYSALLYGGYRLASGPIHRYIQKLV